MVYKFLKKNPTVKVLKTKLFIATHWHASINMHYFENLMFSEQQDSVLTTPIPRLMQIEEIIYALF